jgi:hypothetical protein
MNGIALRWHALILAALVVNLWVGGAYIEAWFGHGVRAVAELALILAWLTLVVGMRAPLPWRRRSEEPEERR